MADDHDALLARADYWLDGVADSVDLATGVDVDLVRDLAAAVRDLRADYLAALDVIARLTTGWDARSTHNDLPPDHAWFRDPILADPREDTGPDLMSDREWRVFCEAAQRATRNTT